MNTPRMKKQQEHLRKSLSAKKGPVKGLRNVLSQPYDTQWPTLTGEEASRLEELLKIALPKLKHETQSLPWSQLRKMGKDERRAAREKFSTELQDTKSSDPSLNAVRLGINAVTRGLEKEEISSVLLDSGVEPLLIKHVIAMAQAKKVPIFLVPFLKKLSLDNVGFASACLGFKKEATLCSNVFYEVYQEIVKFAKILPEEQEITLCEENQTAEKKIIMQNEMDNLEETIQKENVSDTFTLPTDIYKYRSTKKERSFVPPSLTQESPHRENWGDFIALGEENPEVMVLAKNQRYMEVDQSKEESEQNEKKATYLPLKVKRIQGNNNRVKATKVSKPKKKKLYSKK